MGCIFSCCCCCCRGSSTGTGIDDITCPHVLRQETKSKVSERNLPEGVILHGGEKLHKEGLTGKGVRVAVIDSGVDKKHPGFRGQVKKQTWLRTGTPLEQDDHGTHVAGTIHLMAPEAELYDYRVFGRTGRFTVDQAIVMAIKDATDKGCKVINMSLGGPLPNPQIKTAVEYAASKGVIVVCAAGNEGDNNPLTNELSYPAAYEECISVAAVQKKNGFPVAVFSNSNAQVDYAGIGVDVNSFKPGGGYQIMSGTSMACPHVAGLVACLITNGSANTIRQKLNEIAIDIGAEGIDKATGVGFATYLNETAFDELLPRRTAKGGPRLYSAVV
jgi:subtilisin family serine protease